MKVREFITLLADMGAHADIQEFEVQAYDGYYHMKLESVTGVTVSPQKKTIIIHTDEL